MKYWNSVHWAYAAATRCRRYLPRDVLYAALRAGPERPDWATRRLMEVLL